VSDEESSRDCYRTGIELVSLSVGLFILYSSEKKVCVLDINTWLAKVYQWGRLNDYVDDVVPIFLIL